MDIKKRLEMRTMMSGGREWETQTRWIGRDAGPSGFWQGEAVTLTKTSQRYFAFEL